MTKAVLDVVKEVREAFPNPPASKRRPGRPRKRGSDAPGGSASGEAYHREAEIAEVQRLRREGCSIRGIVRQKGISRNTVRSWLRENQQTPTVESPPALGGDGTGTTHSETAADFDKQAHVSDPPSVTAPAERAGIEAETPPAPWSSWDEVREFSQTLLADRFMLVSRPEHLTQEERDKLEAILHHPAAEKVCIARRFVLVLL